MRTEKTRSILTLVLLLGALTACVAKPEEVATSESTPLPSVTTKVTALPPKETPIADGPDLTAIDPFLIPLPAGICEDLEAAVAAALGAGEIWLETDAPFDDFLSETYGRGCLVSVFGTGADFSSIDDVFDRLSDMLLDMGWLPDLQYDAGGPTGTAGGFRKGGSLVVVSSGWEPSVDANCPQNQPIIACNLAPEQLIYTITLSAATR